MAEHMSHEEYVNLQRIRVVRTCRDILDGDMSVIEGVRKLYQLMFEAEIDALDPDCLSITGIHSQTDHLPIGRERKHWAPKALAERDIEIKECEMVFTEEVFQTCRNLVSRFEKSNSRLPDWGRD